MGVKRLFGVGVGPERWGWALLALTLAFCVAASVGVSAVQLHAEAQADAAALEPFRFAEIGSALQAEVQAAAKAVPAPASAGAAKGKGKGKKKNKHIKYKTVDTLAELPWREIEFDAAAPSKRSGHSVTPVGKRLFVFGGCYLDEVCYADLREYNTVTDVWVDRSKSSRANSESMGVVPSVRSRHTATLTRTADGPKIIVFGGSANELYRNDVFIYDVKKNAWAKPVVTGVLPKPRAGHAAAMWHGRLYVTGGYTPDGYANDLAVLDTTIMAWSAPPVTGTPPTPRAGHSFTRIAVAQNIPDSARAHGPPALPGPVGLEAEKAAAKKPAPKPKAKHPKATAKEKVRMSERLVLFGGANDRGVNNDLYIFDAVLMTWSQPAVTGLPPAPRHDHVAATRGSGLWLNGGCDIRKLTCYNDTVVLDTDSLTWKDPMYAVKLKVPYLELVADPDDVLANIRKDADAAVKKDDARRQSKAPKNKKKKKRGFWDRVKSAAGMKFRQTHTHAAQAQAEAEAKQSAAEHEQQLLRDAALEEAEEEQPLRAEHGERDEQLSAATSADAGSAPHFVESAIDSAADSSADEHAAQGDAFVEVAAEMEVDDERDAGAALAEVHASSSSSAAAVAAKDGRNSGAHKRKQRKRHTDKSKPKNSAEEDPVKDLMPRGGHSGAFVGPDLYVIAGCYLEEKCAFDLMYLHVPGPKKLRPQTRNRPPRPHGTVRNGQPSPAPVASTKSIAELLAAAGAKAKAKGKGKAKPKQLQVDGARVGAALIESAAVTRDAEEEEEEEEEEEDQAQEEEDQAQAEAVDSEADATEEAEAPATAFFQGTVHTRAATTTRNARSGLRAHAAAAAATKLHAKAQGRAQGRAHGGEAEAESEAESESEAGGADFEMDITAEAAARERGRLMGDKRARLLRAVREYHDAHPQKGDRDLTAEQRDARDAAEVEATIDADLHGGIGLYTDGELQIGNYTSHSAFKSMTDNKLFLPLTITIGILVIGCLVMLFVWLWMRDKEADAEQQRQRDANAKAQAAAALAMPQGLDPLLASDPGARAALAKDIAAQKAAAEAAAKAHATPTPEALAATQSDREALLSGTDSSSRAPGSTAVAIAP